MAFLIFPGILCDKPKNSRDMNLIIAALQGPKSSLSFRKTHFSNVLKVHVHPKDTAYCIEFRTDGKSEKHSIKLLELFQNVN